MLLTSATKLQNKNDSIFCWTKSDYIYNAQILHLLNSHKIQRQQLSLILFMTEKKQSAFYLFTFSLCFLFVFQPWTFFTMNLMIVRIDCKSWEMTLNTWDNLETVISNNDDSEKIWHVYSNDQNCILTVEVSILNQL